MAVRESRRTRREDDEDTRDQWTETEDSDDRESDDGRSPDRQVDRAPARRPPARHRVVYGEVFDPRRDIPVALLRLARNWSETGSVYQSIHAYTEVLIRYPETGAADAAVEELLLLADMLAKQGRFYAALNIFNKLEQLC
jgi:hypothetical protein